MRVLFSSTSGFGHVFPMLPLAGAFRDAGHVVLWATATQATPVVTAAGIDAVAWGASGSEEAAIRRELRTRAESVEPAARGAFVFPLMFGEALTPPMVVDLIVHENAELAAPPRPATPVPGGRGCGSGRCRCSSRSGRAKRACARPRRCRAPATRAGRSPARRPRRRRTTRASGSSAHEALGDAARRPPRARSLRVLLDLLDRPGVAVRVVFPRADFVVQEGAGHFPWIDDPGEFASLLAPLVS